LSAQTFEIILAKLYTDHHFRRLFLQDPQTALRHCELTPEEKFELMDIDKAGLLMASHSFFHKRKKRIHKPSIFSHLRKLMLAWKYSFIRLFTNN